MLPIFLKGPCRVRQFSLKLMRSSLTGFACVCARLVLALLMPQAETTVEGESGPEPDEASGARPMSIDLGGGRPMSIDMGPASPSMGGVPLW